MYRFDVQLGRATAVGRLYPSFEASLGYLVLRASDAPVAAYTVVVDHTLIIRVTKDDRIKRVELLSMQSGWKITPQSRRLPTLFDDLLLRADERDLHLAPQIRRHRYQFDRLHVGTFTDASRKYVHISIGRVWDRNRPIRLSSHCLALLSGATLGGFLVRVEEDHQR